MKKFLLFLLTGFLTASCTPSPKQLLSQPSLRTTQVICSSWSFHQIGKDEWMKASVPGVVHTDLFNNGKIENPFSSTNELSLQWIEAEEWEYQTTFTPSQEFLSNDIQELVFKGLDTYADVYVNDSLVLSADNMFLEWRIPLTNLKEGTNSLRVLFHSAYKTAEPLAKAYPVKLPADNDKGEPWKTSVFTRKAPYSFGWDWGPRFATVGIWRPVELQSWTIARIDNIQYIQTSQSQEKATLDANITLLAAKDSRVIITLCDSLGQQYARQEVELKKDSLNRFTLPVVIENPKLWWPNGSGEPNLYNFNAIISKDIEKLDQKTDNIGIRTVRWVQEKDSVGDGVSFYVEVNGVPIFSKGANYIPQDVFLPRVAKAKYEELINTTVKSNMNMLRVWGGGIYEEDLFYDLCDKNGIMVWQDFIFGCSLYPWDKPFFENVEKEAIYNVRRLRNHPSIVIWCGNNEITELWHHWGYQKVYGWSQEEQDMIFKGMEDLFYKLLPNVLSTEDSTRYYHPSSPLYGRGNPKSQIMGDVHYWGVFHDEEPFSVYKDKPGRYSNEYGFESLACYDTYREYFKPEEMKLYSQAMIVHQKNPKGYRVMEEYMVRDLPLLKDNFRTYVYLTQLLQAEGIKIAMEGHRSKRPWTMGSLYWQLNDCWPVASWSSMDSEMRWKALQFYAKRSFAPTILSFEKIDSTSTLKLWGITDKLTDQKGNYTLTLMDFSGKQLWQENADYSIAANTSKELMHTTEKEMLLGVDPAQVYLVAQSEDGMRAIYYFTPLKDLKLPKTEFEVSYKQKGTTVVAKLRAKNFLKSVLFEADALQKNPSDGYFDMLPGETKEVTLEFKEEMPLKDLGIFVTTLNPFLGRISEKPITQNVK
ncbi:MAG: glycoside hydrolase family 2 protein [Mucinivorans sp.]